MDKKSKKLVNDLKNQIMKKLTFIFCLFGLLTSAYSQKMDFWLDAGLKVQSGATLFLNSAVGDDDNWDFTFANTTKFGGKLGINWNHTGLSLDVMIGKTKGRFQNTVSGGGAPDQEISLTTTDIYLLFRDARNKGYIELGPKMSLTSDVRRGDKGSDLTIVDSDNTLYTKMPLAAVIGFGTYVLGNDGAFSGIFGLRFEYGFSDIVTEAGQAEGNRHPVNYVGEASATNPIFAGIVFELNWGIGGVGQARCGERSKFVWF